MSSEPDPSKAPSAERRSNRAHAAVLAAATTLCDELGYARLTVDAIATRAGVSKATIYRWWPNKASIVMEGFLAAVESEIAFPDSGSTRRDVSAQLLSLSRLLHDTRLGQMALSLLAASQHDPALAEAFRDKWIAPRRDVARAVLERGIQRGELRPDVDRDVVLDLLYGPVYFRLLVGHAAVDRRCVRRIVDTVFDGIAIQADG